MLYKRLWTSQNNLILTPNLSLFPEDKNFAITNDEIKKRKNDLFPNLLLESSEKRKGRQAWGPAFLAYVLHLIPSKVADHNIAEYLLHTSDRSHPTS
jgi:hypothetical protein